MNYGGVLDFMVRCDNSLTQCFVVASLKPWGDSFKLSWAVDRRRIRPYGESLFQPIPVASPDSSFLLLPRNNRWQRRKQINPCCNLYTSRNTLEQGEGHIHNRYSLETFVQFVLLLIAFFLHTFAQFFKHIIDFCNRGGNLSLQGAHPLL